MRNQRLFEVHRHTPSRLLDMLRSQQVTGRFVEDVHKLERNIGRELRPSDPIVPFLVNAVGWMITRFQPRSVVKSLRWVGSCGTDLRHE